MDDKFNVALIGVICVTAIELMAIYKGINGTFLAAVVGAVTTIIGFCFGITVSKGKASNEAKEV